MLSAEPTGCNSTWYVGYEFESDVQAAMDHLRNTRPNLKVTIIVSLNYVLASFLSYEIFSMPVTS